ncbi:MAG: hypothetical protein ACKVIO_04425 [Phycisphaerales bacterium]
MRFCLTFTLFFIASCSTPKTEPVVHVLETTIEPTADGLMVTKIIVSPDGDGYNEMLATFGKPLENGLLTKSLKSEGMSVRVIESVDMPAILSTIGTMETREFVWHGQFVKWRDVVQRRIPPEGILIVASGVSHFVDQGYLSILARSWLLQRASGLFVYVQLLPSWHIPESAGIVLTQGVKAKQSTLFRELEIEFLLEDGQAVLLTTELEVPVRSNGPHIEGPVPVRLGEGLLGGDVEEGKVVLLLIEATILTTE